MKAAALLLPLVAAAPAMAPARPATGPIPCNPPIDTLLRLTLTQELWRADGTPARATITRLMRFKRDRDGLAVSAAIAAIDADHHEPHARERLILAYGTPGDVPVVVRLDTTMAVTGVVGLDAQWADFRRRQAALATVMTAEGAGQRAAALGPALDAMDPAQQAGMLSAFLAPVLRHCGAVAPADAQVGPDGSILIDRQVAAGTMQDSSRYAVDPRTGLLRTLDRSVTSAAAPLRPLREHWSLTVEN